LGNDQGGNIEIHNSILSELAVMGFEYGYSYSSPNALVIWEAQFGDFANSAQMVIDQYLVSGKAKWLRMSGIVLLLPHGYEGQGPEHSSARLERFLQLGANNNITVANCTTPASIFHLLRRQALRSYRNPLIVMTPKSLLRHKLAVSKLADFAEGTFFKSVIEDDVKEIDKVEKVIFCSGKVYYDLYEEREKQGKNTIALIRLEELYPYPKKEILEQLDKYKNAKQIVWCQEEHKNMGAWHYIKPKFEEVLKGIGSKLEVEYVGRDESASPAAGYMKLHLEELSKFLKKAFE
jgi:2-oxoglutarate dehydrogenase E1 component